MRFPYIIVLSMVILCIACVWSFYAFSTFTFSDIKEYSELVKSTDPKNLKEDSQPYVSTQQHRSTHKDIWFTQSGQRLQLRLRSADTQLVLEHQDRNTQIVEHMQDVTCFIQEELYYLLPDGREVIRQANGTLVPRRHNVSNLEVIIETDTNALKPMQVVRYLEADKASYYYQTDRFFAEQVHVSRVVAPGHKLIDSVKGLKPIMTGLARSAEFSIVGNELNFTAYQLKATLHSPGAKSL